MNFHIFDHDIENKGWNIDVNIEVLWANVASPSLASQDVK